MLKRFIGIAIVTAAVTILVRAADVPHGSSDRATAYYRQLATTLGFRDPQTIFSSTLDDLSAYLGYAGLSGRDLQRLAPDTLMDPDKLIAMCTPAACLGVEHPDQLQQALGARPLRHGDILTVRFFAPKIMNINDPPNIRQLGWRKLIRLRARPGSLAATHAVDTAIILLNFFTNPGQQPFDPAQESANTQVILTTNDSNKDSIYWLDYDKPSLGGRLSLQLNASFDARNFQPNTVSGGTSGVQPYYVPDGCVGCHGGENEHKALVNYLDTDHWFDRLNDDFTELRDHGVPVMFDAATNDTSTPAFARAFDVIRQFNEEAEAHAQRTNPQAFHTAAVQTWLSVHQTNNDHVPPVERSIPGTATWTSSDAEVLGLLNRYCFRCHGTIKFNIFDKAAVLNNSAAIKESLKPNPEALRRDPNILMPRDRIMSPSDVDRLLQLLPRTGGQ